MEGSVGPRTGVSFLKNNKNFFLQPGFELQTVQYVARLGATDILVICIIYKFLN